MEFAVGYETKAEADAESRRFTVVEFDSELWFPASRISRDLSRRGQRIGTPDCMIAATAIAYDQSVVTLNHAHFSRIAGLRVEAL
jgi:predicted nucleic acid-binding protein